jgi:hypothetical protein
MAAVPTLDDVKAWLGIDEADTGDDVVLSESLAAAVVAQALVCVLPADEFGDPTYPDDLREALFLRTQRLAARRNSPEGVVGLSGLGGDFVSARVPSWDSDVAVLEGPYLRIAVS